MDSNIHILLADADEALRTAARRALDKLGYTVTLAEDGAEALARVDAETFDVVIAALLMPKRDGLEVLRHVRAVSPETQFILLAEPGAIGSAALALREGAFQYLPKPIEDFRQLAHTVERAVEFERLKRQAASLNASPAVAPAPSTATTVLPGRLTTQASAGTPLPDLIQQLLQSGAELFQAPYAALLRSRGDAGLELASAVGYADPSTAARGYLDHVGDAFAWKVATERATLVEPASTSERFVGTPLAVADRLLGVLVVYPVADKMVENWRTGALESLAAEGSLILEMARLAAENDRLDSIDPLTGALKRAGFLDMADREFRRSWRFGQHLTAVVLDIDDIALLNNKYGHAMGDKVLRQVSAACRSTVRAFDLVAHYDTDAFAILLVMTDHGGARGAAERLRRAVNSIDLTSPEGPIHITAAVGACTYPREGCASIFDLLDLAQGAQRAARRNGSNHVIFA